MEDRERVIYCGNLSDRVTEDILYELFLQAGPLEKITIPKDKDGRQRNFAFITFKHAVSVPYTVALMNGVSLYGKPLRLDARTGAAADNNPYLEQLRNYRLSITQQNPAPYGYNPPDSRRFEPRFNPENNDYNNWNMYPQPVYPVFNTYDSVEVPNQMRMSPNLMIPAPQTVSYPFNRYPRNQNPWSGKRH